MNHTFISYLGGSAGDMFTASVNGILLDEKSYGGEPSNQHVVQNIPYSIKKYEHDITTGKNTLANIVQDLDWTYISTHLFDELPTNKISITVRNSDILNKIVCRQMQLQQLRIVKDSGTFYTIIMLLCHKHQYHKAATVWFDFAKKYAHEQMQHRISATGTKLDFSELFNDTFISAVKLQGWTVHLPILEKNHKRWLQKQPAFSKDLSIYSIEQKLKHNKCVILDATKQN
jgi:hypothetical protein